MQTEQLQTYYAKQHEVISRNLPLAQTLNSAAIHQLRVAVKKLRAYSAFLSDLSGGDFVLMHYFEPIHRLFKKAGRVRDAHVQLKLLKHYEQQLDLHFPEFENYFREERAKHEKKFTKMLCNFDVCLMENKRPELEQALAALDLTDMKNKLAALVEQKVRVLQHHKTHGGEEERLHDFRKLFKELMYTFKLAKDFERDFKPVFQPKKMSIFAKKMGYWHDQTVMLTHFYKFKKQRFGKLKKKQQKRLGVLFAKVKRDNLSFMYNFEDLLLADKLVI